MGLSLTIDGITYTYPQTGEKNWGAQATAWAQAVTNTVAFLRSPTAPLADSGQIRLGNADSIEFRNTGDTGNLKLYTDGQNKLFFNDGVTDFDLTSTAAGDVNGPGSSTDNAIARWDSTGGVNLQNSLVTISDTGQLAGLTDVLATGTINGSTGNFSSIVSAAGLTSTAGVSTTTLNTTGVATFGDGTGTTTTPDLVINKDSGDATIRLRMDDDDTFSWDLRADNSDTDAFKLEFAGVERFKVGAFASGVEIAGSSTVNIAPSNIASSITPADNTLYANIIPKAWARVSSAGAVLDGVNLSCSRPGTGTYNFTLANPLSSSNYAVIATPSGFARTAAGNPSTTSFFSVLTSDSSGVAIDTAFNVVVFGEQ